MTNPANEFRPSEEAPHALPAEDILQRLGVSTATGLSDREARRRLEVYGPNAVAARQKARVLSLLLHQLKSPAVYLLSSATGLALYFGEWQNGGAIAAVLVLNTLIGFLTELRAARSIEALRLLGTRSVRVRRDGATRILRAEEVVPGDIVVLEAGDSISADLRLIEASSLAADESTLTGESVAVDKSTLPVARDARLAERNSMLFKGTTVTRGSGVGAIVATGMQTELGRISQLVSEAEPGSSPIEQKLARLTGQLVWATLILAVVLAGIGLAMGRDALLMVKAAIALAVAAIPEGLPVVATLTLARGMWRMAGQNALIERLSAVETLGATTVILADKTGTLTENRMTVRRLWLPSGEIHVADADVQPAAEEENSRLTREPHARQLLEIAVLCNNATLGNTAADGTGDPMELAMLRAGRDAGVIQAAVLEKNPVVRRYAFDTATKMMATVHRLNGQYLYAVKGAPEAVLANAPQIVSDDDREDLDDVARNEWLRRVERLGSDGLRVLACAMKIDTSAESAPFEGLTLVGLIGLEDPPRADVRAAIQVCKGAGVRVVMVTGDHAITASSIGHAVGLSETAPRTINGAELPPHLPEADRDLLQADIFARVSPAEKLGIVRAYQRAGEIVAMTGDGVNDAPALRQADIGIAMGQRGTDVAREAAAMILLDDAFATIVRAIREGRVIFGNIRRFAAYLLSCNLSEVLVVGLAILATLPLPILPLQILYLNLVTDVFPAFALAMGEGEPDVMSRPPRNPREPILGRTQWLKISAQSIALASGTLGALAIGQFWLGLDRESVVTVTFLTLAFAQLWHVFNMHGAGSGIWWNEVSGNPWVWGSLALCTALLVGPAYWEPLTRVLQLAPPDLAMWTVILGMSLAPLFVIQLVSAAINRLTMRSLR